MLIISKSCKYTKSDYEKVSWLNYKQEAYNYTVKFEYLSFNRTLDSNKDIIYFQYIIYYKCFCRCKIYQLRGIFQ